MATFRQRGGQFHAQVRMSGYPTRTASFRTRRLAERWATTVEAEMIEGRHFRFADARKKTVADAIGRYIKDELPRRRDTSHASTQLAWWKERIGDRKLAQVSAALLADCKSELARGTYTRGNPKAKRTKLNPDLPAPTYPRSGATVNRYIAALSKVFSVARREWHWVSSNPFEGVSKFKEGSGRARILSADEQTRLLARTASDPTLHLAVMLALSTAPRAGEIVNLEWPDVDIESGRILLRQTKNGQPRTAWAMGKAHELLKAHHERAGKPSSGPMLVSKTGRPYRYDKDFRAACDALGMSDFRFHDLRHSAATYLAREGATEQQLKAIGGWKSNVVSRYVHLAAEDARAMVEKMNAKHFGKIERPESAS